MVPTDVVEVLEREHDRLVALLERAFAATGTERHALVERLRGDLSTHLAAEHRVLDPAVRASVEGGRPVLATLRQHEDCLTPLFARLSRLGDYASEYADVLVRVETHVLGHRAVADADLHPRLRESTSPAERRELGAELTAALAEPGGPRWRRRLIPARAAG